MGRELGESSSARACRASVPSEPTSVKNMAAERRSSWPDSSSARTVFSKVGAVAAPRIWSTSARWAAIPARTASASCASETAEKSGSP